MNEPIRIVGIIPARAGSVGVKAKNVRSLLGKPVIEYTIEAALQSRHLDLAAVTSDDPAALAAARRYRQLLAIERPADLAQNSSRIDDVMRHAVLHIEQRGLARPQAVALLYANVPVRAEGIIDRAIELLDSSGADSVQTVCNPGKFHPYWLYKMEGDRINKYIDNQVFRRQELPELYAIDGAVLAVRTECLMAAAGNPNPHAFLGQDRRAIVQDAHATVDIDNERDFYLAEAILRQRQQPESF